MLSKWRGAVERDNIFYEPVNGKLAVPYKVRYWDSRDVASDHDRRPNAPRDVNSLSPPTLHRSSQHGGYENSDIGISTHTRDIRWAWRLSSAGFFKEPESVTFISVCILWRRECAPLWFICGPPFSWNCAVSLLTSHFEILVRATFFIVMYFSPQIIYRRTGTSFYYFWPSV